MKNECGGDQKDDQQKGTEPCKIAKNHRDAAYQFQENGSRQEEGI